MPEPTAAPRARGRPRSRDGAIHDAGWALLAELGYDNLTFEAVAERAQCSRATLYRRFASKLDLVRALLGDISALLTPPAGEVSARKALLALGKALRSYSAGPRNKALLSIAESATRIPELEAIVASYMAANYEPYVAILKRAAPTVDEHHVRFVTSTFAGMVRHNEALHRSLDEARLELFADAALFMLTRGLSSDQISAQYDT